MRGESQLNIVSKSRSACLLRAARDIKNTHNVHTDNLATGLLDLFELPRGELKRLFSRKREGSRT